MGFLKKKFREKKKFPNWIYILPAFLMRIYYRFFFRHEIIDPHDMVHESRGVVAITWHNRLFFYAVAFPKATRQRSVAVVSASRDGQYVSDFISQLGLGSIRGSSSRGGAQAQLAGVKAIQEGKNVCFTPDGPRGPKYQMKAGPVHLASLTGARILPVAINFSSCWELKSWDNFQIPKPFSKVTLIMGETIPIPPNLDAKQLEEQRQKIQDVLMSITKDPN
jgi:lysophospholipid acyltransferase (LPLAT)-like uncharacterized protein